MNSLKNNQSLSWFANNIFFKKPVSQYWDTTFSNGRNKHVILEALGFIVGSVGPRF